VDKVAGSRIEVVEGGHMLPITQVELTAAFIEAALQGVAAKRARDAAAG
jgi:carboxypeptidase C (cathepsin A)